ncbi:transposase family protein [Zobellella iuensis]|uniref:Transposase family protein n=1 Tax=Zobellella iuensis TaxID=2803811 RepID=A0ABS1QN25_9GAMM|nr:transposase family protein [Zobellella iuensis]MBL1376254.1 transposase family protein [Zobellella iuensis]
MARPRTISDQLRAQVIELRRRHTVAEVASKTGLPVGTVKTIIRRSGAFTDNPRHRALFTLPPMTGSAATNVAAVELPAQRVVTGDRELDAILWLRELIQTEHPDFIDKALKAASRIKTPAKELERRYAQFLSASTGNNMAAAFGSFNFADLEFLAKRARERAINRAEASARFGGDPDMVTEADRFCVRVLKGAKEGQYGGVDNDDAADRFREHTELMPRTLEDCLYELAFHHDIYRLRNAATGSDGPPELFARQVFTESLLAEIRPRSKGEARAVFRYLCDQEVEMNNFEAIIDNLLP